MRVLLSTSGSLDDVVTTMEPAVRLLAGSRRSKLANFTPEPMR
jgi:hypothetical protein